MSCIQNIKKDNISKIIAQI